MKLPTMLPFNERGRELYQGMPFCLDTGLAVTMGRRNWSEKAGARGSVDTV